jgi:integrase
MPRKMILTWVPKSRRWMKQYKNKAYFVSVRQLRELYTPDIPETEVGSYQYANQWWDQKRYEIDHAGRPPRADLPGEDIVRAIMGMDDVAELQECPDEPGVPQYADEATVRLIVQSTLKLLAENAIENGGKITLGGLQYLPQARQVEVREAYSVISGARATSPEQTVQAHADQWLKFREVQVGAGELSPTRYRQEICRLKHFLRFVGPERSITAVNKQSLDGYNQWCKEQVAAKLKGEENGWKAIHAKCVFGTAEMFCRWLVERELVPAISTLGSNSHSFRVTNKEIPVRAVEDFQAALKVASDRSRLYLLLAANTSMLGVDIAFLRHDMVDWEGGYLTRVRTKHEHRKNPPVVKYPLWPETFRLLKEHRSQHPKYVLLSERGTPLATENSRRNGSVENAYETLKKRLPGFTWTPKSMRQFGASLLRENEQYADLVDVYLCNAAKGITDTHYGRYPQTRFNQAIQWMGARVIPGQLLLIE